MAAATSSNMFQIATIAATATPSFLVAAASSISSSIPSLTTAMASSATSSSPDPPENTGECELLGPFAVLIQAALGALALLALVYKRWRERPQRPLKIWAFDASKQVFGSVLLHLANLFMSMFSAGEIQGTIAKAAASTVGAGPGDGYQPNPCSFYLLNLGIDTTLGIPILIIILRVLTVGASLTPLANPPESIQSGNYGTPPRVNWWLKQSLIYFVGLLGMKTCVFIIFELCPWIVQVGDWALRWTEGNEAVQIAFVMLIFPLIMNGLQYYIIDGFIKNNKVEDAEDETHGVDSDLDEQGGLLAADEHGQGNSIEEDEANKDGVGLKEQNKPRSKRVKSYDPDKDGEINTPVGESSSSGASRMEEEADAQKSVEL